MNKLTEICSIAIPFKKENVDTDQIIPARFLKAVEREGFAGKLFYNWLYNHSGKPKKNFILNRPVFRRSQILVVGRDFGIGSSREHAVWALYDWGIRVIIGTSFGDIFYQNSLKNGLLIVKLKPEKVNLIFKLLEESPLFPLTVNLKTQQVKHPRGIIFHFSIDPYYKNCLLLGLDDIGYILSKSKDIEKFEKKHKLW